MSQPDFDEPFRCRRCGMVGTVDDFDVMGADLEFVPVADGTTEYDVRKSGAVWCQRCGGEVGLISEKHK